MTIDKILEIIHQSGGYIKTSELLNHRVHTSEIRSMVEQGIIEQIKRGLYRLPVVDLLPDETFTHDYMDAAKAVPDGVFCLGTALHYHGLSTYKPTVFDIAIPRQNRDTKLYTVSIRYYRFKEPYYSMDIQKIKSNAVIIKIYNQEKSICDAMRLRHMIGEDIAMESLNTFLRKSNKDISKLVTMARKCKVQHIIEPVVKATIGF